MRNSKLMLVGLWFVIGFVAAGWAMTFEYADGTKIEGDIIQAKPEFLQIRLDGNRYEKIAWDKLSQTTLKELAGDPKFNPFIQPYLEEAEDATIKKTEVVIKPVPRLERPVKGSLLGGLLSSSVGLLALLLVYAANIYAGYEISVVRAYPAGLVCGIAAVAPLIGPAVFLCLPTKMKSVEEEVVAEETPAAASAGTAAEPAHAPAPGGLTLAQPEAAPAAALPETQIFKRGQFTFNRRFIETKFAGFFGLVRRDAEKDLLLIIKSSRGEFTVTRISRIAANDLHADVHRGGASQEVQIPFGEILEIQIKHRDA